MVVASHEILDRVVADKLPAAISVPGATPAREVKIRFLAEAEPQGKGLWVQALDEKRGELDVPIAKAAEIEVAFTLDNTRSRFRTFILKRDRHFWLTESVMLEALLLKWPREVLPGERRAHPRYPVGDDGRVIAQVTRTSQWAPPSDREIRVKIANLSLGGAGFITPLSQTMVALPAGEPLRVAVQHEGRRFEIPARLAGHRTITGNTLKFGVQFEPDKANWAPGTAQGLRDLIEALARREALRAKARATAKA